MNLKKTYQKLKLRYGMIKRHPLTKENASAEFIKYLYFNLKMQFNESFIYNWLAGLQLEIKKGDAGIVGNLYYGLYEFEESAFLLHYLRADDSFMDVGANLGHFSLLSSGIAGAITIAVEPVPTTYKRLKRHVKINDLSSKIFLIQNGVASKNGSLSFSTAHGVMNSVALNDSKQNIKVDVSTIDEIADGRIVNALKIDVEGFEFEALKGAEKVLNNPELRVLILELNDSGKRYGVDDLEIVDLVESYGFKAYNYDPMKRAIRELNTRYNQEQFNTLFLRDLSFCTARVQKATAFKVKGQWI